MTVTLMGNDGSSAEGSQAFQVQEPPPPPTVKVDGLPEYFDQGTPTNFNFIFENLDDTDQYTYRADVITTDNSAADTCEGTGLGGNSQYTDQITVDADGITVPSTIAGTCPTGTYTVTVTLMGNSGSSAEASQGFQVQDPPQQSPPPLPTVKIDGLPSDFDQGEETSFSIVFENLNTDTSVAPI